MVAFNVPENWREYCQKSTAWCDGFRDSLRKANQKHYDSKLATILREIDGSASSHFGPSDKHTRKKLTSSDFVQRPTPVKKVGAHKWIWITIPVIFLIIIVATVVIYLLFCHKSRPKTLKSLHHHNKTSKRSKISKASKNASTKVQLLKVPLNRSKSTKKTSKVKRPKGAIARK